MAACALADREIERHALLSSDPVRRQHVDDRPHTSLRTARTAGSASYAGGQNVSRTGFALKVGVPLALVAAIWVWAPHELGIQLVLLGSIVVAASLATVLGRKPAAPPAPPAPRRAESDDAVLASLGIDTDNGETRAACARVARRIHNEGIRVVGFVPAEDQVAVPPILIQLGIALTELTGATIAVVDANVRYPGLGALNEGKQTDSDESVFSTRWLHGSLALLSAPEVERAGEVVPQLARVLIDGADLFAHVLVDLTGFELLGEHASAAACMDAVALVGRAHRTREHELVQLAQLMPHGRFLGVLLVG